MGLYGNLAKTRTNVKFSIVPEEGWFGQPKYSTPSKNHPTLCRFLLFYSSFCDQSFFNGVKLVAT